MAFLDYTINGRKEYVDVDVPDEESEEEGATKPGRELKRYPKPSTEQLIKVIVWAIEVHNDRRPTKQ